MRISLNNKIRRNSILFSAILVLIPQLAGAQVKFKKDIDIYPAKFLQDDGILIIGATDYYSGDLSLYKTNENGDNIWSAQLVLPHPVSFQDYTMINDSTFLILGLSDGIALIKAKTSGDTIWTRYYPVITPFLNGDIVKADDGGFVISFNTRTGDYNNKINLMKIDASGGLLWTKIYGSPFSDVPYKMVNDIDGGYLIAGHYTFGTAQDSAAFPFLLKVNSDGDSIWIKKYEFGSLTQINEMIRTSDGGLMIAGILGGASLLKTNGTGDTIWMRRYEVEGYLAENFHCIVETSDKGFLVGGNIDSYQSTRPGGSTMALFKIDKDGNMKWHRFLSERLSGFHDISDIIELEEGYLLISGSKKWFFRTDKNGCLTQNPVLEGAEYYCQGESTVIATSREFTKYLWSTGDTTESIIVNSPGEYSVQATDSLNCAMLSNTMIIKEMGLPDVSIIPATSEIICAGNVETLTAEIANFDPLKEYAYLWGNGLGTNKSISVEEAGLYEILVSDKYGCNNSDSLRITVRHPFSDETICVVTVGQLSGRNLVVWEKTPDQGIQSYNIYRDQGSEPIGNVPFGNLSIFVDETADPKSQQYLYSLSVIDTCSNESPPSPWHKPLFLQYVSSIDGVNLRWSKYEIEDGEITFDNLEIWRGSDSTNLTPFASNITIQADAYTDIDQDAILKKYYYRVAAILDLPCMPSGAKKADPVPYLHSLSNIDNNKINTGIEQILPDEGVWIYPNPVNQSATIKFPNHSRGNYKMVVTDLSGKICRIVIGITSSEFVWERGDLKEGIYFLELTGPKIYRGKIVIE